MGHPDKPAVRSKRRAARRAIAAARDLRADGEALARHTLALLASHGIGSGSTTTLYESLPVEPQTAVLLEALHERGLRVLLPITLPDLDLDWFDAADPDRQPLGKTAVDVVDLALIPGLSVSRDGTRLGQGGGCYDKALPRMRPDIVVVTLLHPGELLDTALPREEHDRPVDGVVTASGWEPV